VNDEYFVGKLGESFSVSEMLDSVISKAERAKQYGSFPASDFEEKMERRFDQLNHKLDSSTDLILDRIETENRKTMSIILNRLDASDIRIINFLYEKIEQNEINDMEIMQVLIAVGQAVEQIKNKDNEIRQIADNLNAKTDSLTSKFKLNIPIIPLLLSFEQEIDVSETLHKFWRKWKDCVI
jgi:hypothetical protein